MQYIGTIVTVLSGKNYGYVGIKDATTNAGNPHGLPTDADVFIHQDDCSATLRVGTRVMFTVIPDPQRENCFRAEGAVEYVEGELIPINEEVVPGFNAPTILTPNQLVVSPTSAQRRRKEISPQAVAKVTANLPMPTIPRSRRVPLDPQVILDALLNEQCGELASLGLTLTIDTPDEEIDAALQASTVEHAALGFGPQINNMQAKAAAFKDLRQTLRMILDEGLVREDAILPIRYLPDLYMADPVWYFWTDPNTKAWADETWTQNDPKVGEAQRYFCDLFQTDRWIDTFLLFNRRVRTLAQYTGDIIPPQVTRRIQKAVNLFDYVVIMTPYHDQAGKDWQNIEWLRSIDPYVVGFKKGLPYFFVLARFSDSGTFPLHSEQIADTMDFLAKNKEKVLGYDGVANPFWYRRGHPTYCKPGLGNHLLSHINELSTAFANERLFDWLRGEDTALTKT